MISSGAASSEALAADVEREIDRFEPAAMREQIKRSWDAEPNVSTVAEFRDIMTSQMPFHFWEMGDAYRTFTEKDETVYSPEVLAHFAKNGYGGFEWVDHLRWISKPMLVVTGRYDRTCTVARSQEIHDEVAGSRAGGDREGGAHDAHRAAQGADGRGAHVVHRPGRDRPGRAGGNGLARVLHMARKPYR